MMTLLLLLISTFIPLVYFLQKAFFPLTYSGEIGLSTDIFPLERFVPWHISLILLCPLVYLLVAVIFYNISSRVSKKAHSSTCEKNLTELLMKHSLIVVYYVVYIQSLHLQL